MGNTSTTHSRFQHLFFLQCMCSVTQIDYTYCHHDCIYLSDLSALCCIDQRGIFFSKVSSCFASDVDQFNIWKNWKRKDCLFLFLFSFVLLANCFNGPIDKKLKLWSCEWACVYLYIGRIISFHGSRLVFSGKRERWSGKG